MESYLYQLVNGTYNTMLLIAYYAFYDLLVQSCIDLVILTAEAYILTCQFSERHQQTSEQLHPTVTLSIWDKQPFSHTFKDSCVGPIRPQCEHQLQ